MAEIQNLKIQEIENKEIQSLLRHIKGIKKQFYLIISAPIDNLFDQRRTKNVSEKWKKIENLREKENLSISQANNKVDNMKTFLQVYKLPL